MSEQMSAMHTDRAYVVVGLVRTGGGQTEVVGLDIRQLGELDVC